MCTPEIVHPTIGNSIPARLLNPHPQVADFCASRFAGAREITPSLFPSALPNFDYRLDPLPSVSVFRFLLVLRFSGCLRAAVSQRRAFRIQFLRSILFAAAILRVDV